MKNVFITAISLQGRNGLQTMTYEPDFDMERNLETSFPIIPVVANYMDLPEDVTVIAVRQENKDTPDNFNALKKELSGLNIKENQIKEILIEGDADKQNTIHMMLELIDAIPENSLIYEDCTYGTKTTSAMMLFAMILAEKMKMVEVKGLYYGELIREKGVATGIAKLHNITAYKSLIDIVEMLSDMGISDIRPTLDKLLN